MKAKEQKGEYYVHSLWRQLNEKQKQQLLREVGRSRKTLYRWMKDPRAIPYHGLCIMARFFNQELRPEKAFSIETLVTPLYDVHHSK